MPGQQVQQVEQVQVLTTTPTMQQVQVPPLPCAGTPITYFVAHTYGSTTTRLLQQTFPPKAPPQPQPLLTAAPSALDNSGIIRVLEQI